MFSILHVVLATIVGLLLGILVTGTWFLMLAEDDSDEEVFDALDELVQIKALKDHQGMTPEYLRRRTPAWAQAALVVAERRRIWNETMVCQDDVH